MPGREEAEEHHTVHYVVHSCCTYSEEVRLEEDIDTSWDRTPYLEVVLQGEARRNATGLVEVAVAGHSSLGGSCGIVGLGMPL